MIGGLIGECSGTVGQAESSDDPDISPPLPTRNQVIPGATRNQRIPDWD